MATTVPATGMLGRYQVLRPLAKGGMAEVLLARALGLAGFARYVVIKRIRVENVGDQKAIDMFLDEARLVASLHHRNIVQVHDVGEEEGKYFFVMEYVHGRDTRELLRKVKEGKQQLPLEHVVSIASAAAAGLHYAHEQRGPDRMPLGIVHRDISPGNILVAFDGGVKVVDFGIAKAHARAADTQAGERKGKVGYMSPEQCRAEPVDRRTDVFQLGIVLWELCTVRRLFNKDGRFETMAMIADGEIPSPSRFRPDLPAELEQIVMKALAKDPGERYQTADELRIALESFAAGAGLTLSAGRLSDYLKELFGDVPEPWLTEDLPPPDPAVLERVRTSQRFSVPTIPPELVASVTEQNASTAEESVSASENAAPAASNASASGDAAPAASPGEPPASNASDAETAAPVEPAGESPTPVASTGEISASVASAVAGTIERPADAAKPAPVEAEPAPPATRSERAATPNAASAPAKPATAIPLRGRDTPVSWPVDPRSVRARRRWLIALGVLAAGVTAFLIAAFSGPDVPPASSSPPAATPPAIADAQPSDPAVEHGSATDSAEPVVADAAVEATDPHEPAAGSDMQPLDTGVEPTPAAPDTAPPNADTAPDAPAATPPKPTKPTRRSRPRKKPASKPATPAAAEPAEPAASPEPAAPPENDSSAEPPAPPPAGGDSADPALEAP